MNYDSFNMLLNSVSDYFSCYFLGTLAFVLIVVYYTSIWMSKLPPFPVTPLPVIGNLLSMEKDSRALFAKWRKEHGEIFSLYLGSKLVVVLNGYDCVKEALVKKADVFSDRPDVIFFSYILHGQGVIATSGPLWKSHRKFALTALRDFGFGRKSMEGSIIEEVRNIIKFIADKKGEKQTYSRLFNLSTSNVICAMLFGHRFEFHDENFLECCNAIERLTGGISNLSWINFFPFLAKIPGGLRNADKILKDVRYFEEHLINVEIKRHYENYDGTATDFVYAYIKGIKEREEAGLDASSLKENFTQTMIDLFVAGTETTGTTLKWLILFLIRYPEIQEKCFNEIKDNVGLERFPALDDKPVLPYLEAVLAETQRRSNLAPLGVLHATADNVQFRGFDIPKDTIVMTNLDSILMDPDIWPNPEEFRPERFLDKTGAFIKREELIPFSVGRRVCLGESLAKMELFLFSAALIQKFKFLKPDDEPTPSMEPVISIVSVPQAHKVRAVLREA